MSEKTLMKSDKISAMTQKLKPAKDKTRKGGSNHAYHMVCA